MIQTILKLAINHANMETRDHAAQVALACHSRHTLATPLCFAHDLVEDTDLTLADIESHLAEYARSDVKDFIEALDAISRRVDEPYRAYIQRVAQNELATIVKLADLKVNMARCESSEVHESLLKRYRQAYKTLTEKHEASEFHI